MIKVLKETHEQRKMNFYKAILKKQGNKNKVDKKSLETKKGKSTWHRINDREKKREREREKKKVIKKKLANIGKNNRLIY